MRKLCCLVLLLLCTTIVFAQINDDAKALIKEGVELNNQKKYSEAIEKFNSALKIDPGSNSANYQMGFTLFVSGKGLDAVPYLEKVIKSDASANMVNSSYELLGSIYDQAHQPQKAIDYYKAGIKANPDQQSLYYNLGLAYFRNKQYPDAEQEAITAIKLDPKHAGSQRLYALVTFHQNKRMLALMGFCSFLMLEPQGPRAAEAYGNIQHILRGGALKPDGGYLATDPLTISLNRMITQATADFSKRRYASPADLLTAELKAIFLSISPERDKTTFFLNYYADCFYKMAQSPNIPAFARLISSSADNGANVKWIKDHPTEMTQLDNWISTTTRTF